MKVTFTNKDASTGNILVSKENVTSDSTGNLTMTEEFFKKFYKSREAKEYYRNVKLFDLKDFDFDNGELT